MLTHGWSYDSARFLIPGKKRVASGSSPRQHQSMSVQDSISAANKSVGKMNIANAEAQSHPRRSTPHTQLRRLMTAALAGALVLTVTARATAQSNDCDDRHPMGDAWFTGPMLANSAAVLPRGHALLETYLYDSTVQGVFDRKGVRHSAPSSNGYGTISYLVYAVTDKLALGLLPTAGYNQPAQGASSSGIGLGDWTFQAQRKITQFDPCRPIPGISLAVQQSVPTGRFDRLGSRPADGQGSGAYTTTLAFFSQHYFWMPNRRILRARFDLFQSASITANVEGVSVYGTPAGFRGKASPGKSFCLDAAFEYSLTRRWVLASDVVYHRSADTLVSGTTTLPGAAPTRLVMHSGSSDYFGFAPAVEYSRSAHLGFLFGARIITSGRNTAATIMPAFGINFVR